MSADLKTLDDPWKWYWAEGTRPENYNGPEDTREAAIQAARAETEGAAFTIIEARHGTMARFIPTAEDIIIQMCDRADDYNAFGEDDSASEQLGDTLAAEADLKEIMAGWFERHAAVFPKPWVFAETRNEEAFPSTLNAEQTTEEGR